MATVILQGPLSYSARGYQFHRGRPEIITNEADIAEFKRSSYFRVLEDRKPVSVLEAATVQEEGSEPSPVPSVELASSTKRRPPRGRRTDGQDGA